MQDSEIINGINSSQEQRVYFEKQLYTGFEYFIREGCRKYRLSYDDSFSAYSDAVLAAIHNIIHNRFDNQFSLKTYLFQIYSNKCVDLIRKITNNKQKVNQSALAPELLSHLPDAAKTVIEKLIDHEKLGLIRKYLDLIGDKCKDILLLFEDGYSDIEIAGKMAYNNAAVAKTTRLRCREKLKALYAANE